MNFQHLIRQTYKENFETLNDFNVEGLAYDSRKIKAGSIFFAVRGLKQDGNKYIGEAIGKGAKAVITESENIKELENNFNGINFICENNIRKLMAKVSAEFYDNPQKKIKAIAVTGTNGKTTIVSGLKHVVESAGIKCGLLGTVDYIIGDKIMTSSLTTPDSIEVFEMLSEMVKSGLEYCVMEVSSIALVLDRVYGIDFTGGVFTNLSSEHLDLHKDMENYFAAKKILFDDLNKNSFAISNKDDFYGERILKDTEADKIFYSVDGESDFKSYNEKITMEGLEFDIKYENTFYKVKSSLTGRFNIYNILAIIASAVNIGIEIKTAVKAIETYEAVNGRFNKIKLPNGAYAVIDYSHTSDSLKNAIEAAIEIRNNQEVKGKIITIFGCGGNKDRTKRPVMGDFATSLSDYTIITSDNPRFEKPMDIIEEIIKGIDNKNNYEVEENRELAIKKGIEISGESDIILICGKGHENYQEIKGVKYHFDDKEIVNKYSNPILK